MKLRSLNKQRGIISGNAFGGIFFIAVMVFLLWTILASTPRGRIERVCEPTHWIGKVFIGMFEMWGPQQANAAEDFFNETNYSCKYLIWRQFYYDDWLKSQPKQVKPEVKAEVKKDAQNAKKQ